MNISLPSHRVDELSVELVEPAHAYIDRYPGETGGRQPVHSVYGGAQLFKADTATRLGVLARQALEQHAPDAPTVYERVRQKLAREAVEDYRIDFEDGFGVRTDAEEDEGPSRRHAKRRRRSPRVNSPRSSAFASSRSAPNRGAARSGRSTSI